MSKPSTSPVSIRRASESHKLAPVRYEDYEHPASGRIFRRPFAQGPFVVSTYVSIKATCPENCPWKDAGCYAQSGFTAHALRMLDAAAGSMTGVEVIEREAAELRKLFMPRKRGRNGPHNTGRIPQDGARGGRDLRLHVSGDVPLVGIERAVNALAQAAWDWRRRGGGAVWTYTHQWRAVARAFWGPIRVLASCDRPEEVREARELGYGAALVVSRFPNADRAFNIPGVPGVVVPCPAQTKTTVTCATCRLCFADLNLLNITIGFKAHGSRAAAVRSVAFQPSPGAPRDVVTRARYALPVVR